MGLHCLDDMLNENCFLLVVPDFYEIIKCDPNNQFPLVIAVIDKQLDATAIDPFA